MSAPGAWLARPGSYALILRLRAPAKLCVGRLGEISFEAPWYLYAGSAFGPGGLAGRLAHHLRPAPRPHWHVDFLRGAAPVVEAWASDEASPMECARSAADPAHPRGRRGAGARPAGAPVGSRLRSGAMARPAARDPLKPKLGLIRVLFWLSQVAKHMGFGAHVARAGLARMFTEKMKRRAFEGYTPGEHDVFVATFAKSGTNWMMQMTQQIAWRGAAEFDHIHEWVPWPDSPGVSPVALSDTSAQDASPTGLRVIKTHLETAWVPYSEKARYVTVVRDPKEVLVSSYWFLGGMLGVLSHVTIDDWFDIYVGKDGLGEAWAEHTASWWALRDRPNVLVMTYNEVKRAPRETVARVADLMGVHLSEEESRAVAERSSFEWMKANGAKFDPPPMPFMKEGERPAMVRRGETGGSDELLTPEQQAAVDALSRAALERRGSDFPYAEAFGS